MLASSQYLARYNRGLLHEQQKKSIRSEFEMVSRKMEKGEYLRELSRKASMGL